MQERFKETFELLQHNQEELKELKSRIDEIEEEIIVETVDVIGQLRRLWQYQVEHRGWNFNHDIRA